MSTALPFSKTLIIMPTFKEIENIKKMIETLFNLYPEIHLLIIDDNSPDGTAEAVKEYQKNNANIHMVQRKGKLGLGTAYVAGFKWALNNTNGDFDYIFEMDCDFSHDPKSVADLLKAAQENDLVIGSRYIDGIRIINWPFKRLLLSYLGGIYARFITGLKLMDTTGGFKCFRKTTLQKIDLDNIITTGYSFQLELNYKVWCKGLRVKEVPIIFYERIVGQSKMSGSIIKEALFVVIKLRLLHMMGKL